MSYIFRLVQSAYRFSKKQLHAIEMRRILRLKKEYENQGFWVLINRQFFSGVDLLVFDGRTLCKAVESANYGINSHLNNAKAQRYIRELTSFPKGVEKILVISFSTNFMNTAQYQAFINAGIKVRIEGFQD